MPCVLYFLFRIHIFTCTYICIFMYICESISVHLMFCAWMHACMYVWLCVYIHICVHVYFYFYVYVPYIYIPIKMSRHVCYACMCVCMYVDVYGSVYVCTFAWVLVYILMYVRMQLFVYACIYIRGSQNGNVNAITCIHARFASETLRLLKCCKYRQDVFFFKLRPSACLHDQRLLSLFDFRKT